MKYYGLKYADAPNPRGVPPEWIAELTQEPQSLPWVEFANKKAVEDYLALHQAAYDQWRADHPLPTAAPSAVGICRSPNGTMWYLGVNNMGEPKAKKVNR